jgi:hypothetical protein
MTSLSVTDLIREGRYETAVIRMQELCRVMDPEVEFDPAVVTAQYEEMRQRLRAVVPPAPFKIVVDVVRS